ncbi:GAF domain-containing protein [Halodesulfovibrio sp.]|jgi:PAS domain-containing protein|uniref:GAF domain-containing protein n=1 Tax=Halodesulfovibrio sp. TaxID=1912772 RepID=UPI0025E77097|nr:GAF domain-containing protein [Halodesulfovibrio sp.]MCT4626821.1 GAF domain-containing protein [Halodesulfovibrio sp.]
MESKKAPVDVESLEGRVARLEDQTRFTLDALELAASLGEFEVGISSLHEPTLLLREVVARVATITPFAASAVYLVDEGSSDFYQAYSDRQEWSAQIESAITSFIDSGMFTFALREGRPVIVHSVELQRRVVLHVLETSSRVRGMFVGVFSEGAKNLTAVEMALLSIVCKNCASAVEVFELYKCFKCGGEDVIAFSDSLPAGVVDLSKNGRILITNKFASKLLGSVATPEKRYLTEFLIPEERERIASLLISCCAFSVPEQEYQTESLAKTQSTMRTQTVLDSAEGQKNISLHITPLQRNGDTFLRGVLAPMDEMYNGAALVEGM